MSWFSLEESTEVSLNKYYGTQIYQVNVQRAETNGVRFAGYGGWWRIFHFISLRASWIICVFDRKKSTCLFAYNFSLDVFTQNPPFIICHNSIQKRALCKKNDCENNSAYMFPLKNGTVSICQI